MKASRLPVWIVLYHVNVVKVKNVQNAQSRTMPHLTLSNLLKDKPNMRRFDNQFKLSNNLFRLCSFQNEMQNHASSRGLSNNESNINRRQSEQLINNTVPRSYEVQNG